MKARYKRTWGWWVRNYFPTANYQQIDFILWNLTCYPFDSKIALRQLKKVSRTIKPKNKGWTTRMYALADQKWNEMSEAMAKAGAFE